MTRSTSQTPPLTIKGHRALSDTELGLINAIKTHGDGLAQQIQALRDHPGIDERWLEIGRTHLQAGIMELVRAVAKPTSF